MFLPYIIEYRKYINTWLWFGQDLKVQVLKKQKIVINKKVIKSYHNNVSYNICGNKIQIKTQYLVPDDKKNKIICEKIKENTFLFNICVIYLT